MTEYKAYLRTPADFGMALQQARLSKGMSQTEVAKGIGVAQSAVSAIENDSATIYLRRLLEIARLTGLTITATWDGDDTDEAFSS